MTQLVPADSEDSIQAAVPETNPGTLEADAEDLIEASVPETITGTVET